MSYRLCLCGSRFPRKELRDGYGIFLTFACTMCEKDKLAEFRPDIMERYSTDEPIEAED